MLWKSSGEECDDIHMPTSYSSELGDLQRPAPCKAKALNGCNYCDDPDVICHEEINACDGFPCQNNGACTDELKSTTNSVDGRSCEFKAGFNGTSCENSSGMFATAPLVVVLCLIYTLL